MLVRTSISGCARLNASNDCRYASAIGSAQIRTVTTIFSPCGWPDQSMSTAVAPNSAASNASAAVASVE